MGLIYHTCASIRRQAECQLQILHHLRTRFFHELSLWCLGGALPLVEAHVRCFPLLAMAVSLMIASWPQYLSRSQEHCILHELFRARMVLNHRLYYQLLKHDLLISFEPLLPSQVHRSLWRVDSVENFQPFCTGFVQALAIWLRCFSPLF